MISPQEGRKTRLWDPPHVAVLVTSRDATRFLALISNDRRDVPVRT
jgi:hypothetical protein